MNRARRINYEDLAAQILADKRVLPLSGPVFVWT